MTAKITCFLIGLLFTGFIECAACCAGDERGLIQYLLETRNLTVFKCKILSTSTDTNFQVTSKALVLEVFLGKVTAREVTLNTGNEQSSTKASHFPVGMTVILFGGGEGAYFYCGGICDNRTLMVDSSKNSLNTQKVLRQFASITRNKKNGYIMFKNADGIIISEGRMEKGMQTGLWKFYTDAGKIKVEYNYTNKDVRQYTHEGYLQRYQTHYSDSTVYMDFIDPVKGIARMREVDFPNDSGFVSVFYDYYPDGTVRSIEGQANLKKENGISSRGKTGRSIAFHENGRIRVMGRYSKDRRVGIWKWLEEDGSLTAEVDYKDGSGNQ